jgi:hypothetical protein
VKIKMPKSIEIDVWIETGHIDDFEEILYNEDIKHICSEVITKRELDSRYSYTFICFSEELNIDYLGDFYQIKNVFI